MMPEGTEQIIETRVTADNRLAMLRDACETMRRSPNGLVSAMSVTFKFDAASGEEEWWRALGRSLAAEHGLREEVNVAGAWFTVRFSRVA